MNFLGSRICCASEIARISRSPCRYASKKAKLKRYTETVNLPQTTFKLSMKGGAACAREIEIQKACGFPALYEWQQAQSREKEFVLHDGPPYANGNPHVGHALNKILKDVTNRYKLLQGYTVDYVPGWDCHGMPIEQKVLTEMKVSDHRTLSPLDIRSKARSFATKALKKQMKAFQRWGVMADWSKQCYYTYDQNFVANELDVFYDMFEKGTIYQDYMPVYWSPSSGSALAEAELEYNEDHESTAVYVKFPVCRLPSKLKQQLGSSKVFVTIWTTTPWTLPANRAICYGDNIEYSFIKEDQSGNILLVSSEFCTKLSDLLGKKYSTVLTVKGSELLDMTYHHPLVSSAELPLLQASHVTTGKGTGLVHTAPAHGPEDFQVAVKYNLPVDCHVDEQGKFTSEMGPSLCGKEVLGEGNNAVLELLRDHIVHQEVFTHSYPYDWRTKQPVIFRACKQWFVNTSKIKEKALESLCDVEMVPRWSSQGMVSQLEMRTYWCISRQRVWGVPIPVFYEKNTRKALLSRESVSHVKELIKQYGTDCWWRLPVEELLPQEIVESCGFPPSSEFEKGLDVLDIWFDSGTTWSSVLKGDEKRSDLYLEGLDQCGGWFQSSLLTSVATQGHAPYKTVVVHGFAVDDDGKKMSKSLGNVVDPDLVINGGKDREAQPAYGADVLRWWAAHSGLDSKVTIGPQTLNMCNEQLFKMRKSLRYLMGNLCDYHTEAAVSHMDMEIQDRYMLHLLHTFMGQVTEAYDEYNFTKITQLVEKFINTHVSAFYCHTTKDRVYCDHSESVARRSCQTVQYHILEALVKVLAPIVPHLAEEVYMHHPFKGVTDSVFKTSWYHPDDTWRDTEASRIMDTILSIRDTFYEAIAATNPLHYDLVLAAKWNLFQDIKQLQPNEMTTGHSGLTEVLGCSTCSVIARPPLVIPDESMVVEGQLMHTKADGFQKERKYLMLILPAENHICERCRRYTSIKYGQPCDRCTEVMSVGWE